MQFPAIEAERVKRGMSLEELAAALEVSPDTIQAWQDGESEIPAGKLVQLAKLWGCSVGYLLEDVPAAHEPKHEPRRPEGCGKEVLELVVYPMIIHEARRRGISMEEIAAHIGISAKDLHDKLCGRIPLFFHEVCAVRAEFFPDVDLETLTWRAGGGALWYAEDDEP